MPYLRTREVKIYYTDYDWSYDNSHISKGSVAALTAGCFWDTLSWMQTTIQLDETLFAQATKLAQAKGCDLSHFIEETLRDKIAPKPLVARQPFSRLTTVSGQGVRPGVDLNNSTALLALMEQGA